MAQSAVQNNLETESVSMSVRSRLDPAMPTDWQPNMSCSECAVCAAKFNLLFRRRHHCRQCGTLVCDGCSRVRDYVAGYKDRKVRICVNCSQAKLELQNQFMQARVNSALSATTLIKPIAKKPAGSHK